MAQGRSTKILSMTKWIWTSRLSIKNSLSCGEGTSDSSPASVPPEIVRASVFVDPLDVLFEPQVLLEDVEPTTRDMPREAVPRRARIQGSQTFVSPNSRLESNKEEEEEEEEEEGRAPATPPPHPSRLKSRARAYSSTH